MMMVMVEVRIVFMFEFHGEPDGKLFIQSNQNFVRKPVQLDYQNENGIKGNVSIFVEIIFS